MAYDWGSTEPWVGPLCKSSPRATQHAVQVFEASKPLAAGGEHASSCPNIQVNSQSEIDDQVEFIFA
jgi:hypothetical protein